MSMVFMGCSKSFGITQGAVTAGIIIAFFCHSHFFFYLQVFVFCRGVFSYFSSILLSPSTVKSTIQTSFPFVSAIIESWVLHGRCLSVSILKSQIILIYSFSYYFVYFSSEIHCWPFITLPQLSYPICILKLFTCKGHVSIIHV